MNKKQLYESIMKNVGREIKKALYYEDNDRFNSALQIFNKMVGWYDETSLIDYDMQDFINTMRSALKGNSEMFVSNDINNLKELFDNACEENLLKVTTDDYNGEEIITDRRHNDYTEDINYMFDLVSHERY